MDVYERKIKGLKTDASLYKFIHRQNSTMVLEVKLVITLGKAMTGRGQSGVPVSAGYMGVFTL